MMNKAVLFLLIILVVGYFVPLRVCYFRFAPDKCETHDYGSTSLRDLLLELDAAKVVKYGSYKFYER